MGQSLTEKRGEGARRGGAEGGGAWDQLSCRGGAGSLAGRWPGPRPKVGVPFLSQLPPSLFFLLPSTAPASPAPADTSPSLCPLRANLLYTDGDSLFRFSGEEACSVVMEEGPRERERERDRQTDRHRDRERQRQGETETDRDRERETETGRDRETGGKAERWRVTHG